MTEKKCSGPCGRTLEMSRKYFGVLNSARDGYNPKCLACSVAMDRAKREREHARVAACVGPVLDHVLSHSQFRRGDICVFRGTEYRVSHGYTMGGGPRVALVATRGKARRMVRFVEFVAEAERPAARAEGAAP